MSILKMLLLLSAYALFLAALYFLLQLLFKSVEINVELFKVCIPLTIALMAYYNNVKDKLRN